MATKIRVIVEILSRHRLLRYPIHKVSEHDISFVSKRDLRNKFYKILVVFDIKIE